MVSSVSALRTRLLSSSLLVFAAATVCGVAVELRTSSLQAGLMSGLAGELRFQVEPGPSKAIRFPGPGPYDLRMGYWQLPTFIERLAQRDYGVAAQARLSPRMIELSESGLFSIYRESSQSGLELRDRRGEPLYAARFPQRVYEGFESVPPLLVEALLFIENRELLDPRRPELNPAVEWDRLANALVGRALRVVDPGHPAPGGSTLATQIEKYRHSPEGRTDSMDEKLRQMASASMRAYLDGRSTLARRRQIVVDYLNTVPLSAQSGIGEVNGLGDGLWAWYGREFTEVNRLLSQVSGHAAWPLWRARPLHQGTLAFKQALLQQQALAFKQALSLLIAQRRPSHYLRNGDSGLHALVNSHLRLMAAAGVVSPALLDATLPIRLRLLAQGPAQRLASTTERKAAAFARSKLSGLLDVPQAYDLERLDLTVGSTIDGRVQRAITRRLRDLKNPAAAREAGLYGFRLLGGGDDPGKLVFSFSLFERGDGVNLLRVQTDSTDQPFDINEGARLDLGSTAKLRTLVTYLELVAALHARWSVLGTEELAAVIPHDQDVLARWAHEHLSKADDISLAAMLEAAMERRYSASPGESFLTGGGVHRFANFERKDDTRVFSVREAFKHSVNLVFIRLMRDVVRHHVHAASGSGTLLLAQHGRAGRHELLSRFADTEGREFIARFHAKYRGKSRGDAQALLLRGVRAAPAPLAVVFRSLAPEASVQHLAAFLEQRSVALSRQATRALYDRHGADRLSLADRGYVAGVHPLELWLVGFLRGQPDATLGDAIAASSAERQQVYAWLFRTSSRRAQDVRIRHLLELEAFAHILRAWQKLGYPFESLTPSYAAAIGASGDRPAALAELMGIIVSEGMRAPTARLVSLVFARDTPYETQLEYQPRAPCRVLPAEVARIVRHALVGVVEDGTARRLKGVLALRDGRAVELGGKTGTGDHRFEVHGPGGRLISSRSVGRTATFAFLIDDRYYGTVLVHARAPHAARYRFTSAMPAQLLKVLVPALLPALDRDMRSGEEP
jgi:membrane peptidoglycan carboxypeptidase